MFVERDLFCDEETQAMLSRTRSGLHVHHGVRLDAEDAPSILQVARYAARAPVALRTQGILAGALPPSLALAGSEPAPAWPALRRLRQHWAELLKRIFEVDRGAAPVSPTNPTNSP